MQNLTASLIARAATLHADLAVEIARSRGLIERSLDCLASSPHPRLRRIQGGSTGGDLDIVGAAINGAPLCLACITRRTSVTTLQVEAALKMISHTAKLVVELGPCGCCRTRDVTFTLPACAESRLRRVSGF